MFGVYAPGHDVARLSYFGLFALQHRGQESAGIATCEGGMIMTLRDLGLVSQVFDEEKLRGLAGDMAIGHVRYSTTGGGAWENTQPVWRDDGREVALAHNGNLTNAVELYAELRERGIEFRGTSDSEIIAALLSSSPEKRIEDAVAAIDAAARGRLLDGRDDQGRGSSRSATRTGVRPLALGVLEDGRHLVASESCAFDIVGAKLMREVKPGELVSLSERGLEVRQAVRSPRTAALRLRAHLLLAPRLPPRGPGAAAGARADGRDPLARGAGRRRPRDLGPRLGQPGGLRASRARRGSPRTTG